MKNVTARRLDYFWKKLKKCLNVECITVKKTDPDDKEGGHIKVKNPKYEKAGIDIVVEEPRGPDIVMTCLDGNNVYEIDTMGNGLRISHKRHGIRKEILGVGSNGHTPRIDGNALPLFFSAGMTGTLYNMEQIKELDKATEKTFYNVAIVLCNCEIKYNSGYREHKTLYVTNLQSQTNASVVTDHVNVIDSNGNLNDMSCKMSVYYDDEKGCYVLKVPAKAASRHSFAVHGVILM